MPITVAPSTAPLPITPLPSAVDGKNDLIADLVEPITARRIMNLAPLGTPFSKSFARTSDKSLNSFCVGSFLTSVLKKPSGKSSFKISFSDLLTPVS